MGFVSALKCSSCGSTWCRKESSTKQERFLSWFNQKIMRDSTAKYMQGPYKVYCEKCDARRPELEKRDYVTR